MCVTMSPESADAVFIAEAKPWFSSDFPNTRNPGFRKLLFPLIQDGDRIFGRDGEQEFEILAIGQSGQERRFGRRFSFGVEFGGATDGNGAGENFRADLAVR